jgi:hypothetical protein
MTDTNCKDCRGEYGGYMVNDELWASAGLGPRDFCCRSCLSNRLGRPLTNADYTLAPVNFESVPGFATEENYHRLNADAAATVCWLGMLAAGEARVVSVVRVRRRVARGARPQVEAR